MTDIFISYRRSDSDFVAATLYEKLKERFGPDSTFMDVHDIPLGCDFAQQLDDSVGKCQVLLALIGEGWSNARFASGPLRGQRRIEQRDDLVRIEINSALKRDIPLIPVLIGKVTMGDIAAELPSDLERIITKNAATLRGGGDLRRDMDAIIERVEAIIQSPNKRIRNAEWKVTTIAIVALLGVIGLATLFLFNPMFQPINPKFGGSMSLSLRSRGKKALANNPAIEAVLPLLPDDEIEFEAKLDQQAEAYFYVIQIDSDGRASLKFPRSGLNGKSQADDRPRTELAGVDGEGGAIVLEKSSDGIQSLVWFVRDRPLSQSERVQLDQLLANLKWELPEGWEDKLIADSWENGLRESNRGGPDLPGVNQSETPKTQTVWLCSRLKNLGLAQYSRATCFSFKKASDKPGLKVSP